MTDKLHPVRCGCGGEASMCYGFEHRNIYAVECDVCGICTCIYDTEAKAITAWNRAMGSAEKFSTVERTAKVFQSIDGYRCGKCFYRFETTAIPQYCPKCGARLE